MMSSLRFHFLNSTLVFIGACTFTPSSSRTVTALGTADTFAVLGGSTVTNTGSTTIVGDVGVSPGLAVTGFPPGLVTGGVIHGGDAVALQAQQDLTAAYVALAGNACDSDLTGQDLGGLTLTPGVYCFSSSAQLTGQLTLDAQGNADALFVFQIGSTLTTASNSSVLVINGAGSCNAFWQVGSSATLGTGTTFTGSILALTSITLTTGARVFGRALARNGAVTMDTNHIEMATCAVGTGGGSGSGSGSGSGTPIDGGVEVDAPGETCLDERCGDVCVDLHTDNSNCGACGNFCSWDLQCVGGSCSCMKTSCGDVCVDTTVNPLNCGACGNICGPDQWCDQGLCTSVCAGTVCSGWCTNLMTNESACGACGNQCGSAETCSAGVCVCSAPSTLCGTTCLDLTTSATNCGTCGNDCGANQCCVDGQCAALN